jgi:hypothetical protein
MSSKSCEYIAGIKYSRKTHVKGGGSVTTKTPGLNWTPSINVRKKRAANAMNRLLAERKAEVELVAKKQKDAAFDKKFPKNPKN